MPRFILPDAAAWRQTARILIALAIAYAATHAAHLRSGYWAMITVAIVVQGNVGGTLDAGLTQLAGTVVGGTAAIGGVWLRTHHLLPDTAVLALVLAPLALLSSIDSHLRTGPVTALIVLLITPSSGSSIELALSRIVEIAIGSLIGITVSILVLPSRARQRLDQQVASALRALGDLARSYATDEMTVDGIGAADTAIRAADEAHVQWQRERSFRVTRAGPIEPLLHAVRRVRTDVLMLGRAADCTESGTTPQLGTAVHDWFMAAANAVCERRPIAPPSLPVTPPDAAVLAFCRDVLQRDLTGLAERIAALAS